MCVQCGGLGQSFQNQIAFQPPDDSEAKKNSDLTEIIINVRYDRTRTHAHKHRPRVHELIHTLSGTGLNIYMQQSLNGA